MLAVATATGRRSGTHDSALKHGFKSIKSIVKIRPVGGMPNTSWNMSNPSEYGF
jgi:hypothetical protein